MKCHVLLSALFLIGINSYSTIIHVPAGFATIQSGLNSCNAGDTVLVQPGTYVENVYWPLIADIKLLSAGDSSNTIIDGDSLGSTISFFLTSIIDTNTIIRGFKITGGASISSSTIGSGIVISDCSPKFESLAITGNSTNYLGVGGDGAGIRSENSNFILTNSSVYGNQITDIGGQKGGGICIFSGAPVLRNVKVFDNFGNVNWLDGGGIASVDASPTLIDVEVFGNLCKENGSRCYGGGMYFSNNPHVVLKNVSVHDNYSGQNYFHQYGGGIYIEDCDTVLMDQVEIFNNQMGPGGLSYFGGGLYVENSNYLNLINVNINNNIMGNDGTNYVGAGALIKTSKLEMAESSVQNNMMGNSTNSHSRTGAGLCIGSDSSSLSNILIAGNSLGASTPFSGYYKSGGAIYCSGITSSTSIFLTLRNCTLAENKSADTLQIKGSGICYGGPAIITGTNCILWNSNQGLEIAPSQVNSGGIINFSFSDIRGGYAGIGNIDTLPGFVSTTDFHLNSGSPCLAAGTLSGAPTIDLDSLPRPAPTGSNPDMGCYELDQPLAVFQLSEELNKIQISPNPSSGIFTINSIHKITNVEVYDSMNKKIIPQMNESTFPTTIDIHNHSKGVYFLLIQLQNGSIISRKVMIL